MHAGTNALDLPFGPGLLSRTAMWPYCSHRHDRSAHTAEVMPEFAASAIERHARKDDDIVRPSDENRLKLYRIDQLFRDMAILYRWKFRGRGEQLACE